MAQVQRDLTLIYEGADITNEVDVMECTYRDVSCGETDCLNIQLDHAEKWFRWGPKQNDRIRVQRSGYDTQELFLNTVVPEDGAYRIYATARKCVPLAKKWQAYQQKSLSAILGLCAAECGMTATLHGVNGELCYDYLLRENMTAPQFMEQLANREGAVLKTLGGKYAVIGVEYAQGLDAMHELMLEDSQLNSQYIRRHGYKLGGIEIKTPFGYGRARDRLAEGEHWVLRGIPAENDAMAYRFAKNLLLMHNRHGEMLNIEMDFNPGYTAMVRMDVSSETDAKGKWLIHEVEHDLLQGRTRAKLLRCVEGII